MALATYQGVVIFGGQASGDLYGFGGQDDAGQPYELMLRSNRVAMAGEVGGEAVWSVLYLVVTHTIAATLIVTPVIDGVAKTGSAVTVGLPTPAARATYRGEVSLSEPVLYAGVEVARVGLRGTWFQVMIETQGGLTTVQEAASSPLVIDGMEVEGELVHNTVVTTT